VECRAVPTAGPGIAQKLLYSLYIVIVLFFWGVTTHEDVELRRHRPWNSTNTLQSYTAHRNRCPLAKPRLLKQLTGAVVHNCAWRVTLSSSVHSCRSAIQSAFW
jgi:hypothetical protein